MILNRVKINIFGRWLAMQRAIMGDTQESLAARIGEEKSNIGHWERGELPAVKRLPKIMAYGSNENAHVSETTVAAHWVDSFINSEYAILLTEETLEATASLLPSSPPRAISSLNFLGEWVRTLRGKTSPLVFARELGISSLWHVESGKSLPKSTTLLRIFKKTHAETTEPLAWLIVQQLFQEYLPLSEQFQQILNNAGEMCRKNSSRDTQKQMLAKHVKLLRGSRSQREFGQLLNINQTIIANIETGKVFPTPDAIQSIVEKCNGDIIEFVSLLFVSRLSSEYGEVIDNASDIFDQAANMMEKTVCPIEKNKTFGEKLKSLRGNKTVGEAAEMIGIPRSYWSKYECGIAFPPLTQLQAIAGKFDCDMSHLIPLLLKDKTANSYKSLQVNLAEAVRLAISFLPQGIGIGVDLHTKISADEKPNLFIEKIKELILEQRTDCLESIAEKASVSPFDLLQLLSYNMTINDFLLIYQNSDPIAKLAQIFKYDIAHLMGYLGIDIAFEHETLQGRIPENPLLGKRLIGYDLDSYDPLRECHRKIEVTAMSEINPYISLSEREWDAAVSYQENYYLSLVLYAATPFPTIINIQNPARRFNAYKWQASNTSSIAYTIPMRQITRLLEEHGKNIWTSGVIEI